MERVSWIWILDLGLSGCYCNVVNTVPNHKNCCRGLAFSQFGTGKLEVFRKINSQWGLFTLVLVFILPGDKMGFVVYLIINHTQSWHHEEVWWIYTTALNTCLFVFSSQLMVFFFYLFLIGSFKVLYMKCVVCMNQQWAPTYWTE